MVLDGISISCSKGEICGVLGANGAGKSTLFKIITGLIGPSSGSVKIHTHSSKAIGGIIEKPALYPYLNARENISVFAKMQSLKLSPKEIDEQLLLVGLPLEKNYAVSKFSMGMKQRLGIAIALLNNPESLILDEPFSGLDPLGIESLKGLIRHLAHEKGIGIFISSHIMEHLLSLCTKLYVLKNGKIVNSGAIDVLMERHIHQYEISGTGLKGSKVLEAYQVVFVNSSALVSIQKEQVSKLLTDLLKEGIQVHGCKAVWNMESLF